MYNTDVVNRVMTKALAKYFPEDGNPEENSPKIIICQGRKNAQTR